MRSVSVGPSQAGSPLDAVVREAFALSWNRARELVRRGKVSVNGKTVVEPTARVREGAEVVLDLAARSPRSVQESLDAKAIVYADAHVVLVEKPSGVATVPYDPEGMGASIAQRARAPEDEATLDQRVRAALGARERARGRSGPPPELGVVHRLDKETSGLIVFTRSWTAKKALLTAFRFHHVHRRYLALVHGIPKSQSFISHFVEDRGDGLRGSVEHRSGRKYAVGSEKTQRAVTHIEVLETFPDKANGEHACALVACSLETGRTHQIRIHLAEAGHPLLGERVYMRDYRKPMIASPRVMLHAAELGFTHPATGEELRWSSPLPKDMVAMRASFNERGPRP